MSAGPGGGIALFSAGTPTIRGNTIRGNTAGSGDGGGIWIVNLSGPSIVQNLIVGNIARDSRGFGRGGGVFWMLPSVRGPLLLNNTIVDNDSPTGSGIFADGFDSQTELINNLIVAKKGQTAFFCGNFDQEIPILRFNNVFSRRGSAYGGICSDQTGINDNLSGKPLFRDESIGDYRLAPGSPGLDSGLILPSGLPNVDLAGNPRVIDGDGDGSSVLDIGAYEKQLPQIVDVNIEGKNLLIRGTNFDAGSLIFMNGMKQKPRSDVENPATILIGKKLGKRINPGQIVRLQVRDSDGALSPEIEFVRP
jgi:serine protease